MCMRHWMLLLVVSFAGVLPVCVLALSVLANGAFSRLEAARSGGAAIHEVAGLYTQDLTPTTNPRRIVGYTMRLPTVMQAVLALLAALLFLVLAWKVIMPEREVRLSYRLSIDEVAERINGAWERGKELDHLSVESPDKSLLVAARWSKGSCSIDVSYDAQAAGAALTEQETARICSALGMKRGRTDPHCLTYEGRVHAPEIGRACHELCAALMNVKQGGQVNLEIPA